VVVGVAVLVPHPLVGPPQVTVRLGLGVSDAVRVAVGGDGLVRVSVAVAEFTPVADRVGDGVAGGESAAVAVALAAGVIVSVPVAAIVAVAVSVAVALAVVVGLGSTSGPMWRMICADGPGFPSVSSARAVTIVDPSGNASTVDTGRQNWRRVRGFTN
jgi:hypothetical protein